MSTFIENRWRSARQPVAASLATDPATRKLIRRLEARARREALYDPDRDGEPRWPGPTKGEMYWQAVLGDPPVGRRALLAAHQRTEREARVA